MSIVINEKFRGFLFKNGKFIKMLGPGKYYTLFNKEIYLSEIDNDEITIDGINIDTKALVSDANFKKSIINNETIDGTIDIHFVDSVFYNIINPGIHYFWNINKEHKFYKLDLTKPELSDDFPKSLFTNQLLNDYIQKVEIPTTYNGVLFYDNKFIKILEPGIYYYTKGLVDVKVKTIPLNSISLDITGQELLTLDKVTIRLNLICNYILTDVVKAFTDVNDYEAKLYVLCQLAVREYVASKKLDEILEAKGEMEEFLTNKIKDEALKLYANVNKVNVKDVILPGDIREIMNTVLLAEKKAQANFISRREEVASTRSLLNTARLMDENKTLYKLKELEYIEKICEHVGNININGGTDIISTLTSIINSNK